jgi:hypothetical protein
VETETAGALRASGQGGKLNVSLPGQVQDPTLHITRIMRSGSDWMLICLRLCRIFLTNLIMENRAYFSNMNYPERYLFD